MLYDRPYMRDSAPIRHVDYFWWSLWIYVGAFIVQSILQVWFGAGDFLREWVALSANNIFSLKVWTLFTYGLLHGGLWHFLINGLGLFFVGRWISRELAPQHYLHLILGSVFMGGLVWLIINVSLGGEAYNRTPLVGFSAAIMGLLTTACLMFPSGKITMLLFFVIPVDMSPRLLLKIVLAIQALGLIFIELPPMLGGDSLGGNASVGFSAHLGGALAGYLFYLMLQRGRLPTFPDFSQKFSKKVSVEDPFWAKKRTPASKGKFKINLTNRKDLRQELDRILDKINKEGFQSLSPEEQKILDDAADLLKK